MSNIYVKENSNHLISNSSGVYYSEESKINSTDNIYTTNGFVKIINTTYPTKYYKTYKTIFDNYYIPTDTTVTSRFNSDFTETDSIIEYKSTLLKVGDYIYLPKFKGKFEQLTFLKSINVTSTLTNDICYIKDSYLKQLLQYYIKTNKTTSELWNLIKKYYNVNSIVELNFLINSCLKIELNSKDFYKQDLFVYLAYIYLTNRYTLDSDKLIFDLNMSDNINNYLINYFKSIYNTYTNNVDFIDNKLIITSQYFIDLFSNNLLNLKFINYLNITNKKRLLNLLKGESFIICNNKEQLSNLKLFFYTFDILIQNQYSIYDNCYIINYNTLDYYIEFTHGFLLEILNIETSDENEVFSYFHTE